ncbi:MAG: pirin family protein [Candidatus Hydrogenedentota bacterium]
MSITIRRSLERGRTSWEWLESRHTFSFGEYFDPAHHRFSILRVINDDVIGPGAGFDMHPHRDMEILTYVLDGAVAHRDSTNVEGVTGVGEIQRMTAGSGIMHSEHNASTTDSLHLLQIWIMPGRKGLKPGYERRAISWAKPWTVLAAPSGAPGTVSIAADARLLAGRPRCGEELTLELESGRVAWIHVVHGSVHIGGNGLVAGDGAGIIGEDSITIRADADSEILVFDLPVVE